MPADVPQILRDVLNLSPKERAELVERILASFSFPERQTIDALWATEVEDRIDAFEAGELKTKPEAEVFARFPLEPEDRFPSGDR